MVLRETCEGVGSAALAAAAQLLSVEMSAYRLVCFREADKSGCEPVLRQPRKREITAISCYLELVKTLQSADRPSGSPLW